MKTVVTPTLSRSILLLLFLVAGCDCSLTGKWQYKEISRFTSPDSKVDAVLVEGGGGATTSQLFMVYLVPAGTKPKLDTRTDSVFAADHIRGLKIYWKQPKLLRIQYDEARILQFINVWYTAEVEKFRYVVEVRLDPTATDFSLPPEIRQW